jgi:hypothetical protein
MTEREDGGPAFPSLVPMWKVDPDGGPPERVAAGDDGMTLRDWFAGQALNGIMAGIAAKEGLAGIKELDMEVDVAFQLADEALVRRKLPDGLEFKVRKPCS